MEKDFDISKIAGTLKYGNFDNSNSKALLVWAVILTTFGVSGSVVGVVFLAINISTPAALGILIICVFVPLALFCFLRYVCKTILRRKEIELWMEDAVLLKAFSKNVGGNDDSAASRLLDVLSNSENSGYMIRVGFKYNGNHFKLTSRRENCWGNYLDKEIDILYSPKYREVILLKPELKQM